MASSKVVETRLEHLQWHQLQALLGACYPRPPRDVFQRVVAFSHRSQRVWTSTRGSDLIGVVMLSPHSKGGHLDNLAVSPDAQGSGIANQLVLTLLRAVRDDGPAMVTLTTRIPSFFSRYGFQSCGVLADGSTAMIILLDENSAYDLLSQ